jgi:hypothetical protein
MTCIKAITVISPTEIHYEELLTKDNSNVHTLLAQTLTAIVSPLAVLDAGTSTSTPSHQHFRYYYQFRPDDTLTAGLRQNRSNFCAVAICC